ncbi:hypothetical protein MHU86_25457 [Fragilaria crotonensis]|nr:hypothetical protein MHU86_25457 [Fragilaria crotonensis]
MNLQYLEIVTNEVDAVCSTYSRVHGVTFGDPDPNLGNARTAPLGSSNCGAKVGVRHPLHDQERAVVRPYTLTSDLAAAVDSAVKAGAAVAVPPMRLGDGLGSCAIVMFGEIESGFWQVE